MVLVEVRNIDSIGKVIDAALDAGATNVGSVGLYASNTDAARRDALKEAVAKARADAEAVAAAAGGSVGALLELSIDPYGMPDPCRCKSPAPSLQGRRGDDGYANADRGRRIHRDRERPRPLAVRASVASMQRGYL